MAYQATVLPVMIASPGDVAMEREIVREVIHDWNDVNAASSKVILVPVGWDSHSSPELAGRPQEIINSRLLQPCDLLIGVFWTRLGTPTGEAKSGTVEEIERHVSAGKPAMLYFSSRPAAPESIDAAQYAALKSFRDDWCKPRGLVESFDSPDQFRKLFAKQLQIALIQSPPLRELVSQSSRSPETGRDEQGVTPSVSVSHLSADAATLIRAGAKGRGQILKRVAIGSRSIHAGGRVFGHESARAYAQWEAALNELVASGFVSERGYQGAIFELTHTGWRAAEIAQDTTPDSPSPLHPE